MMEADTTASRIFDLSGRTALVTGGSSGIGSAIARAFIEQGADVAITYLPHFDKDAGMPDAAEDFVKFAGMAGRRATAIVADLENKDAPDSIVAAAQAALGRIDILVINASYQCGQPMMVLDLSAMDREYRINLRSTMRLLQLVLPDMAEAGWGRVLSIGSLLQQRPSDRLISYAALKGAQEVVMQQLAVEYGPRGVLVNTLAPGVVATERNRHARETVPGWEERARMGNRLRLMSYPEDYVGAALLLCSEAGRFITGATLYGTGGAHLPYLER